eukprot:4263528-Prymnesium_polylepis.1
MLACFALITRAAASDFRDCSSSICSSSASRPTSANSSPNVSLPAGSGKGNDLGNAYIFTGCAAHQSFSPSSSNSAPSSSVHLPAEISANDEYLPGLPDRLDIRPALSRRSIVGASASTSILARDPLKPKSA